MGIKRNVYKGYKSYSYLDAGVDYVQFEFSPWNWAGEYYVPLSPAEEAKVTQLAHDNIMIALHEHPVYFPKNIEETTDYTREGRQVTAYDALALSYIDCVFDNLIDGMSNITSKNGWKWDEVIFDLGMRLCDIAHQDFLLHCKRVEDIYHAHREGKIAWVAAIEGAAPIENELDRIDILYGLGVRMLGITYSQSNALGSGGKEPFDGGLTRFGKQAVRRMNQVGMLIDCSHSGSKTALDTVEASEKPIILTHIGARALWDSDRLFPDEVFQAVAQAGGVIGIEAAPHSTMTKTRMTHDIEAFMEHFEYVVNLVGIDHVSFGIDSLYGDHVGLHHVFAKRFGKNPDAKLSYQPVPYVKGLENPTEASINVLRWLVKHGYSDTDIAKVLGGNTLRVLKQVWK